MTYIPVATFTSRSKPDHSYTVKEDELGRLSCNCPAWIFKRHGQERGCRHTEEVSQTPTARAGVVRRVWLD